jgi:hypothetical protein
MQKKPQPLTRAEASPWLRLELDTAGLSLTSGELQRLALIPEHLQERMPGHRTKQSDDAKSDFQIEYVPAQSKPYTEEGRRNGISKGGKIAIGVIVPVVLVSVAATAAVAASFKNMEIF